MIQAATSNAARANVNDSLSRSESQSTTSVVALNPRTTAKATGPSHRVRTERATAAARSSQAIVEITSCAIIRESDVVNTLKNSGMVKPRWPV